jgi:hypothetical protein
LLAVTLGLTHIARSRFFGASLVESSSHRILAHRRASIAGPGNVYIQRYSPLTRINRDNVGALTPE